MSPKDFVGLVGNKKTPHTDKADIFSFSVKDAFHLQTFLLFGAASQIALFAILPYRVAVAPVALLGLYSIVTTLIEAAKGPSNAYMEDVILGRASAQLPSLETGRFHDQPAAHPIVVFHFGVTFNHPLGLFAPGVKQTMDHFTACNDSVVARADEYGMLGLSPWRAGERGSSNTLMMVYYFRDVDGLNKFAHDDLHRKAWDWIVKAGHKHIGFFHEAFCVPQRAYESIYVNFRPLLMGATSIKCTDENGEENWVRPIVDANVGPLKSQFGRMGRAFKEY